MSGIDSSYEIPEELWNQISTLVHKPRRRKKKIGRPRMDDRKAMTAIFYIVLYWVSVESATTKKSWCIQYCT